MDPRKVLRMSKSGCRDTVWVQSIQDTSIFCLLNEISVLPKNLTFTFVGWSLASSRSCWWTRWGAHVESCTISAPFSWAAPLLQDWSGSSEVRTLFSFFGLWCWIELAREPRDRAVRWSQMIFFYRIVFGDFVINSTYSGGVVPWKDRWMAAYPGQRESSYRLVFLALLRTRHV